MSVLPSVAPGSFLLLVAMASTEHSNGLLKKMYEIHQNRTQTWSSQSLFHFMARGGSNFQILKARVGKLQPSRGFMFGVLSEADHQEPPEVLLEHQIG